MSAELAAKRTAAEAVLEDFEKAPDAEAINGGPPVTYAVSAGRPAIALRG